MQKGNIYWRSLCVDSGYELGGRYGCAECGEKYPYSWAGPMPPSLKPELEPMNKQQYPTSISPDYKWFNHGPFNWMMSNDPTIKHMGCCPHGENKRQGESYLAKINPPTPVVKGAGGWVECLECAIKSGHGEPPPHMMNNSPEPEVIIPAPKVKRIISFGMKFGPFTEYSTYVVDVRKKVRNPWKEPELRKLVGYDPKIKEFVSRCGGAQKILNYWEKYLPASAYTAVAFSCHGGKHRSVAMAELLAERLAESGIKVEVIHRDVQRAK